MTILVISQINNKKLLMFLHYTPLEIKFKGLKNEDKINEISNGVILFIFLKSSPVVEIKHIFLRKMYLRRQLNFTTGRSPVLNLQVLVLRQIML